MRTIKIPEDILITEVGGEPLGTKTKVPEGGTDMFTFKEFAMQRAMDPGIFGKNLKVIEAAFRLRKSLIAADFGKNGIWEVDSTDWELLKQAVETPTGGYMPNLIVQLLPFAKAITEAEGD